MPSDARSHTLDAQRIINTLARLLPHDSSLPSHRRCPIRLLRQLSIRPRMVLRCKEGRAMWNLTPQHLRIRRLYISILIILVLAVALGAIVGVYWRDDYAQC